MDHSKLQSPIVVLQRRKNSVGSAMDFLMGTSGGGKHFRTMQLSFSSSWAKQEQRRRRKCQLHDDPSAFFLLRYPLETLSGFFFFFFADNQWHLRTTTTTEAKRQNTLEIVPQEVV